MRGCIEKGTEETEQGCTDLLSTQSIHVMTTEEKFDLPLFAAIVARSWLCRVGTILLGVADVELANRSKMMDLR